MRRAKYVQHGVGSWFRLHSASVAIVSIVLAVLLMLVLQALTIHQLQEQVGRQTDVIDEVKRVAQRIDKAAQQRTQQINSLDKHMDCIVRFFAQPDRSNKAISDIDECRIRTNPSDNESATPSTSQRQPAGSSPSKSSRDGRSQPSAVDEDEDNPSFFDQVIEGITGLLP